MRHLIALLTATALPCFGVQRAAQTFAVAPMATPFGNIVVAPYQTVAIPRVCVAKFDCAGNYLRFEVEESVDLQTWYPVGVYHNDYIRTGEFEIPFFTNKPWAFHRIKAVFYPATR